MDLTHLRIHIFGAMEADGEEYYLDLIGGPSAGIVAY